MGNTAQEVIATSENGFPWQASLGANADKVVFIPEGLIELVKRIVEILTHTDQRAECDIFLNFVLFTN